ncbi:isoprenylcysteine carboxylmethyltransferase family protein [Methylocystis iwaonis]|uniref:methyltransferase family protein n=1 Tax=Methylocystis iwaonis TaxID=2885079 RepID=UPI002E7BD554|nr:isoprenylcysteine carboxylmethyltransferase family protein [Methylocystis iwaonis]
MPSPDAPPARAPWPPILIALTILAGLAFDRASGGALAGLVAFPGAPLLGGVIIALALANDIWCAQAFARHKTTILPHRAAAHLVTDGPFRWSRNPIYISHVAVVLGVGLLIGSPFTVLLTPLLAFGLQKLAVEPEERHLAAKFGNDYRAYMARTRRWL